MYTHFTFTLMAHCTSGAIKGSVSCSRTLRQGIELATSCTTVALFFQVPDVDISDYPSDGEGSTAGEMASSNVAEPDPVDSTGRRLLSDWVRSAQALLQTPQKQANCQFKTPDDSNKKRRKFERYDSEPSKKLIFTGLLIC